MADARARQCAPFPYAVRRRLPAGVALCQHSQGLGRGGGRGMIAQGLSLEGMALLALSGLLAGRIIYQFQAGYPAGHRWRRRLNALPGPGKGGPGALTPSYQPVRWLLPLLTMTLFLLAGVRLEPGMPLVAALVLFSLLLLLAAIDMRCRLLPDRLTLPLLWLGLIYSLADNGLTPHQAISGAVLGYLSLGCLDRWFRLVSRRPALGQGDMKLLAALGAWLGVEALPALLLIAATGGLLMAVALRLLYGRALRHALPFGPWLALAGILRVLAR